MSDYAESYLRAKAYLTQAYNHASAGKMADAIRLAWAAEADARRFAVALEAARVQAQEP